MVSITSSAQFVRRAKSGDIQAFVRLCDQNLRQVYRYVHFLAPNNRAAEGLTVQIFFKAWERLDRYRAFETSFTVWLFGIAHNLVTAYLRAHQGPVSDNEVSVLTRGGEFREEFQTIRSAMSALPMDQRQVLVLKFIAGMSEADTVRLMRRDRQTLRELQADALCALTGRLGMRDVVTLTPVVRRILETSLAETSGSASTLDVSLLPRFKKFPSLEPILKTTMLLQQGRDVKPVPAFHSYVHNALMQSLRVRPRKPLITPAAARRAAVSFAMLAVTLMAVGTAQAQSAMPGETLYDWKRTSEKVLYAFLPDPVATDIFLAERRLEEWIVVMDDPALSPDARLEYERALSQLVSMLNGQNAAQVKTALQEQQASLEEAGLASAELDEYLAGGSISGVEEETSSQDEPVIAATPALPGSAGVPSANSHSKDCDRGCENKNPGKGNQGAGNDGSGGNNAGGNNSGNAGNNNSNAGNNNAGGKGNSEGKSGNGEDHGGGKDDNSGGNGEDKGGGKDK